MATDLFRDAGKPERTGFFRRIWNVRQIRLWQLAIITLAPLAVLFLAISLWRS